MTRYPLPQMIGDGLILIAVLGALFAGFQFLEVMMEGARLMAR